MEAVWKILAWISAICGLLAFGVGWLALMQGRSIWVPTEFWFFDAVGAGVFAIFFLMWGRASSKR